MGKFALKLLCYPIFYIPGNSHYEEKRCLLVEIEAMKLLGYHNSIVSILGCSTVEPDIFLMMDYCRLGDLRRYLMDLRKVTTYISD